MALVTGTSAFNNIFWFAADSIDLNEDADVDISFAVAPAAWPTVEVSTATVDEADRVQTNIGDQNIKSDYVRHMAKKIFGDNAIVADVFSNETDLVADIATAGPAGLYHIYLCHLGRSLFIRTLGW